MVGNDVVPEKGFEILLAVGAEEKGVDPGAETFEGEV